MKKRLLVVLCVLLVGASAVMAQDYADYKPTKNKNVKLDKTNLPIVFIKLQRRLYSRSQDKYSLARMKIIMNEDGELNYGDTVAHPNQKVDYEGWIAIKYRGNSSFNSSDKKPYAIRTLKTNVLPDDGGEKEKVKIMGMGKDNKWAVIAPFSDKLMFRDVLSFDLARPWMDFVPTVKMCEFIIDGTYYGVYGFAERVSGGSKRLDLNDPGDDEGDLTGDFLVEVDRDDDPHYTSKYRPWRNTSGTSEWTDKSIRYQYKSPEQEDFADLPEGTQAAIDQAIHDMETSFRGSNFTNPDTGYRKYIDVTSFIDYMLTTELCKNVDGYRLSTNLYKYSETRAKKEGLDSRWKMSLWDFNIAWGNADYNHGWEPTGNSSGNYAWQYLFSTWNISADQLVPFYWLQLMNDPYYQYQLQYRWTQYRKGNYSDTNLMATVDSLTTLLQKEGAVTRNNDAWGIIGRKVWPNYYNGSTYQDEIDYLKGFITKRLAFMDANLLIDENTVKVGDADDNGKVENADAVAVMRQILGSKPSKFNFKNADANKDGVIDNADAVTILRMLIE